MITLGIDPGLSGGVAAIDGTGRIVLLEPTPILDGQVRVFDGRALGDMLRARGLLWADGCNGSRCYAYIEHAQSMPRQGVASTFAYGVTFGSTIAAVRSLGIGYTLVRPAIWKRALGLKGSDKRESIGLAGQHWPELSLRRKDDGLAEALLIARWGWLKDSVERAGAAQAGSGVLG
jgi:hypothetical protein